MICLIMRFVGLQNLLAEGTWKHLELQARFCKHSLMGHSGGSSEDSNAGRNVDSKG